MRNPKTQQQLRMGLGIVIWFVMILLSQESMATIRDQPASDAARQSQALVGRRLTSGATPCNGIPAPYH